MKKKQKNFDTFLKGERAAAANAYAAGNATLVSGLSATRDPATFLGPRGGIVAGAKRLIATNERAARTFAPGGRSTFKIVQAAAADCPVLRCTIKSAADLCADQGGIAGSGSCCN